MSDDTNRPGSDTTDCLDCVDGMALATNDILGTCFRACPSCQPQCFCCNGAGRFPAWTNDMLEFIASLNTNGMQPMLCHTCGGFLAVVQLHTYADAASAPKPAISQEARAALERCSPDPTMLLRYSEAFREAATQVGYWSEVAVAFYTLISEIHSAHVKHCIQADCPTCTALSKAIAAYDAFDDAEEKRCHCAVRDHFSTDCPPTNPTDPE